MCRFPFVFAMLLLLASFAPAQEKHAEPKPPPRESLRYDGKPFEYWQTYWQTELKTELMPQRRINGIRAMRAFGSNGYGTEAAAVIVDSVRTSSEQDAVFDVDNPALLSPEERVFYEAVRALRKIGAPAAAAMLAQADHPMIRNLTVQLLASPNGNAVAISADAVPALMQMASSEKRERRDLALMVLCRQTRDDFADQESRRDAMLDAATKKDTGDKIITAVLRAMRDPESDFNDSVKILGRLASKCPNLKPRLIAELRDLKKARQKDVEKEKKENFPVGIVRAYSRGPNGSQIVEERKKPWEKYLPEFYSPSRWASVQIVNVFGNMGPAARDALPELREALEDPCVELQNAARTAIEQITKKQR